MKHIPVPSKNTYLQMIVNSVEKIVQKNKDVKEIRKESRKWKLVKHLYINKLSRFIFQIVFYKILMGFYQ